MTEETPSAQGRAPSARPRRRVRPVEMVPTYMRLRKDSLPWLDSRGRELNLSRSEMIDRCVMDCKRRWEKEQKRREARGERREQDGAEGLLAETRERLERAKRELAALEQGEETP